MHKKLDTEEPSTELETVIEGAKADHMENVDDGSALKIDWDTMVSRVELASAISDVDKAETEATRALESLATALYRLEECKSDYIPRQEEKDDPIARRSITEGDNFDESIRGLTISTLVAVSSVSKLLTMQGHDTVETVIAQSLRLLCDAESLLVETLGKTRES